MYLGNFEAFRILSKRFAAYRPWDLCASTPCVGVISSNQELADISTLLLEGTESAPPPSSCLGYLTNFYFRCLKVSSPGQVKFGTSPRHRHQSSRSRCEHSFSPNDLKLSGYDTGMDTYKTYISDFLFSWPLVRSFFDLLPFKAYGRIRFLPITFEPGVLDEWKWHQYACYITPNRMIPNLTLKGQDQSLI